MEDRIIRPSVFGACNPLRTLMFGMAILVGLSFTNASIGDEPQWIWSPKQTTVNGGASHGDCYFRKKFTLIRPMKAELEIAAGDEYEVYINGRMATRGQSFGSQTKIDVSSFMQPGVNLIAAKVRHHDGSQVGLAMKCRVQENGESRWRSLLTDGNWKTRVTPAEAWKSASYNDMGWLRAKTLQPIGEQHVVAESSPTKIARKQLAQTEPGVSLSQDKLTQVVETTTDRAESAPPVPVAAETSMQTKSKVPAVQASAKVKSKLETKIAKASKATNVDSNPVEKSTAAKTEKTNRFEIDSEFTVTKVLAGSETGSLVAMEFNEFGKILLSREGGPLLIADPTKQLTDPDRVRVYCDQVNTCQGILPLNGDVYVTGSGPQGMGLYKLSDTNRDGMLEVKSKLAGFAGNLGEHGPHGLQLGPDGMLYVIIGNGSQLESEGDATSPFRHFYEGDLIPRFEDPGGHAKGVKAPGGTVVRISLDGKKKEIVAGGIRNAYDLVFNHQGEMFIHDSDMESDIGTTWYRPTMVFHVPAGAELGWRSGWAKFPQYFVDQTPAVCETGRGSPSGAVLYQHLQFPVRYQDTMFFADWSEGRILSVRANADGAGYTGKPETFLKGRPLNVVDLAVGEDGGLYFCTGGRGTEGGVYRVTWNGEVPDKILEFESDLAKVIRHPQPTSAWARQNIAQLRIAMGDNWNVAIEGVASEKRNTVKFRTRAMQLMVLYGPTPSAELMETLSNDQSSEIRAQAARLCGLTKDGNTSVLEKLVKDSSPMVRRMACESYMRLGVEPELAALLPMLNSLDRIEALSARRLIERIPANQWEDEIFTTENKRLFIQGSVALMTADPNLERAYKVLARSSKLMEGFVNDYDFVDMLRAMELALVRGKVEPEKVPGLVVRIGNEFPSGSSTINRELIRILAFLNAGDLNGRVEEYLQDPDVSTEDKVHLGMHMQVIGNDLTPEARIAIIDALEKAQDVEGAGGSYAQYLRQAVQDVSKSITTEQVNTVLQNGHEWPNAVVAAFYKLPMELDQETVQTVIEMDQRIKQSGKTDQASNQMRLGVIAVLARSGDETSMEYLRELWQSEEDRRNDVVIGLSQQPADENWAYLVSSLPVLDDLTGTEVVQKLTAVTRRPRDARHFRELISVGYRMQGQDRNATVQLLQHWSGETLDVDGNWQVKLDAWRNWFHQKWPEEEKIASVVVAKQVGKHSVSQLLSTLETMGPGNALMGHATFEKAKCATCHQFNGAGQSVGPDLTTLAQRFSTREAIEATIEPSKVIPARYASKKILTVDGLQFSGMAVEQADGSYFVLQSDGKRIRIAADDIEEINPSETSAMPEGLLDDLTPSEINNLFAYMMQAKQATAATDKNAPTVSKTEFTTKR